MAKQTAKLPQQVFSNLTFYDVYELLDYLQEVVKVEKAKYSDYGDYNYYSVSDIYKQAKSYLRHIKGATLYFEPIVDELIGDWHYKRATAVLRYRDEDGNVTEVKASSTARESETEPKKSAGQISGGAESYAKKYTLNSLFLIDEDNDFDNSDISYEWELTKEEQAKLDKKKQDIIAKAKKNMKVSQEQVAEWEKMDLQSLTKSVNELFTAQQGQL